MVVKDQVPVSDRSEVEVSNISAPQATRNKDTGELNWFIEVKPGETRELEFSYAVRTSR